MRLNVSEIFGVTTYNYPTVVCYVEEMLSVIPFTLSESCEVEIILANGDKCEVNA